ncbi:MAG: KH domain-containing protein [Polyangiales bacterium]
MEQLQDLIAYIAKSLVDDPSQVEVNAVEGDRTIIVELVVSPEDLGKVIGREGRTARAMRTLLAATSARHQKRAVLEILE